MRPILDLIFDGSSLTVDGLDIQSLFMSKDKSVFFIKTYDFASSEIRYHSFNTSDMQLIASVAVGSLFKPVFDNNGKNYYGINTHSSTLDAYDLTDGGLLWSTPLSISFPIHFLLDVDESSLVYIDAQGVYRIDKANGSIEIYNDFSTNDSISLIDINRPSIWCITAFCSLGSNLNNKEIFTRNT